MKELVESVKLAVAAYAGVLIGERLYLALSKKISKKELNPGCVYSHKKTGEPVVINPVIPGGLFEKPMVEFLVGNTNKRLQMSLGEFRDQFEYAQFSVRGE